MATQPYLLKQTMKLGSVKNELLRRLHSRQSTAILCCVVGCLFALGPVIHGLFHASGLSHKHVNGSIHSHSHEHQDHPAYGDHDHTGFYSDHSHDESSDNSKESGESEYPQKPHPLPSDDGGPCFVVLELDATDSNLMEVELIQALLDFEYAAPRKVAIFFEPELGSSSPRGPPALS